MYLPPHFTVSDESLAWQLVRDHPFASLISNDDAGLPFVSHLPLHLEQTGPQAVLQCLAIDRVETAARGGA